MQEANNFCVRIEESHPVHLWRYGDIDLWPVIKSQLQKALRPPTQRKPSKRPVGQLLRQLPSLLNFIILPSAEAVLLSHPTCRRYQIEGQWADAVMDPLRLKGQLKDSSCLALEFSGSHPRRLPTLLSTLSLDALFLLGRFWPSSLMELDLPDHDAVLEKASFELKPLLNVAYLKKLAHKLDKQARLMSWLLKKCHAKSLYVDTYYSWECFASLLAAHRLNIKSFDVQHGLQGAQHAMYGQWTSWQKKKWPNTLPSHFLCRSSNDVLNIARWAGKECASLLSISETRSLHLDSSEFLKEKQHVLNLSLIHI